VVDVTRFSATDTVRQRSTREARDMKRIIGALTACVALGFVVNVAHAQRRQAFDSYDSRRPTVSPYLSLLQNQGNGIPQYQTLVRPALEQRQVNQQQATAIQGLQHQQALQARETRIGNQALRPTGHRAGYLNFLRANGSGSYYPGLSR
jgi:hypothetical protein